MSNQLFIPLKKGYVADLRTAVRNYIQNNTSDHPDPYNWDIEEWNTYRQDAVVGDGVHVNRIEAIHRYHAHLTFILTKFPSDIGLAVAYSGVFASTYQLPCEESSLVYEQSSILLNLAAMHSQLGHRFRASDSTHDGLKHAVNEYGKAAGTLAYARTAVLPRLFSEHRSSDEPLSDLDEPFVESLQWLMLAQAEECAWQIAITKSSTKSSLIAKLATTVSAYYQSCLTRIDNAEPRIKHIFPTSWIYHIETKQNHFAAVAQYRKSIEESEQGQYGAEIARLMSAQTYAKQGHASSSRGTAVRSDIQSLLSTIETNLTRAQRDNDLIYHKDIPPLSTLPIIQGVTLCPLKIPAELQRPDTVIASDGYLFRSMLGWGATEAINIYNDNKQTLIQEKVIDAASQLDNAANVFLLAHNLPSSLDALDQRIGLPPSLLAKAEKVRSDNGPEKIESLLGVIKRLAHLNEQMLNKAMDILDDEISESENAQRPSNVTGKELVDKGVRYQKILTEATASDAVVQDKWDKFYEHIELFMLSPEELENSVTSTTGLQPVSNSPSRSPASLTRLHVNALRIQIDLLNELIRSRAGIVQRAEILSNADDIRPIIERTANQVKREGIPVTAADFDDVSNDALSKYDESVNLIFQTEEKQAEILRNIQRRNSEFLETRKVDPSVKARERELQSLDIAYNNYIEIIHNLDEGQKFYNELLSILTQFCEACKQWSFSRRQE